MQNKITELMFNSDNFIKPDTVSPMSRPNDAKEAKYK